MVFNPENKRRQKPKNCLSVFDHFVGLALKGLKAVLKSVTPPYIFPGISSCMVTSVKLGK